MDKIIIIGARIDGHAKVVLEIIQAQNKYQVIGFIDDELFDKGINIRNIPVIGKTTELIELKKKYNFIGGIVAIGNNAKRRELSERIKSAGLFLINAIHPTVHCDSDVSYKEGNVFMQRAVLVTGTKIGNCVNIHAGVTVDHDNILEDGVNLGPGVHLAGRVIVRKDAFLGTGTMVIPDVEIGQGAISGAGTVIINNIESFTKVVGNPARTIERF